MRPFRRIGLGCHASAAAPPIAPASRVAAAVAAVPPVAALGLAPRHVAAFALARPWTGCFRAGLFLAGLGAISATAGAQTAAPPTAPGQTAAGQTEAAQTAATQTPPEVRAAAPLPRGAIILSPPAGPAPRINGARVLGALPGSPVRFEIPATGDRPMRFGATDLPAGLTLDPATGWITGACAQPGDYLVTLQAANAVGRDEKPLRLVIGDLTALTPPMVWNEPAAGSEAGANRRAEEARARSLLAEHGWSSAAAREAEDAAKRGTATPSGGATAETTAGAAAGVIGGGGPGATAAPAASAASGAQVADESEDSWQSMATIGFIQSRRHPQARPGQWQELAPLWVGWIGPADARRPTRLTPDEQSTQLSLWCLLAAPLRLRCDLARLDGFTVSLVTNDEVLALDQDPLGRPATLIARDEAVQTWARPLADGSIAVGFFNLGLDPAAGSLQWSELDLTGPQIVRDLWRQRDLGAYTDRFDAPVTPHGVFLFRLRPAP